LPVQRNRQVAFIDRDGVINRDRDDYVKSVAEFEFLPGSPEALARLHAAGWSVVIVSNQASIAKGIMSMDELGRINEALKAGVEAVGGKIDAMYYCPHRPEDHCDCRKPLPGMLLQASRDFGIDPTDAVFVGDAHRDIRAGNAAGCKTVLVLSGSLAARDVAALDPAPDHVAADLGEAVEWITNGYE
jgi:D-glycero-D-manno-heptose 1,7-bisphosphate phosphatase